LIFAPEIKVLPLGMDEADYWRTPQIRQDYIRFSLKVRNVAFHHRGTEDTEITQRVERLQASVLYLCSLCLCGECLFPYTQLKSASGKTLLAYLWRERRRRRWRWRHVRLKELAALFLPLAYSFDDLYGEKGGDDIKSIGDDLDFGYRE
jgi:hypothetical protein